VDDGAWYRIRIGMAIGMSDFILPTCISILIDILYRRVGACSRAMRCRTRIVMESVSTILNSTQPEGEI
jgi:hypothetical protein